MNPLSMVIFNSYVNLPEGMPFYICMSMFVQMNIRSFVHRKYRVKHLYADKTNLKKSGFVTQCSPFHPLGIVINWGVLHFQHMNGLYISFYPQWIPTKSWIKNPFLLLYIVIISYTTASSRSNHTRYSLSSIHLSSIYHPSSLHNFIVGPL